MTLREELIHILNGGKSKSFPSIIPINPPFLEVMEQAGIFWPQAHKEAGQMADLAFQCNEITGFNCINVPFDMTVEAEALGCNTIWKEGKAQTPQVKDQENLELLDFDDSILTQGRFPVVLEAIKTIHEKTSDLPVIPFIEGPFTIACLVGGINRMFKAMIRDKEKAKYILDRCTDLFLMYARAQIASGADSIIILDPNVMGLREKHFEELILPVYERIIKEIEYPFILHICGDVTKLLDLIAQSGFKSFSFDYPYVKIETITEKLSGKMKVIGSIPTISHLLNGTPREVEELSTEMIRKGIDVLAPSCFISPYTPLENARAMKQAIDKWNG